MSSTKNATSNITHSIKLNTDPKTQAKHLNIQKTVEESTIMSLLSLADAINKKGDEQCQRFGITISQYLIMLYLAGDPNIDYFACNPKKRPILASELADALNVSRANISNLVNLLIDKKLVEKEKGKDDWRKNFLNLTQEGWTLIEKMQPRRYSINRRLLGHLSENDKNTFLLSLQTCLDLLNGCG